MFSHFLPCLQTQHNTNQQLQEILVSVHEAAKLHNWVNPGQGPKHMQWLENAATAGRDSITSATTAVTAEVQLTAISSLHMWRTWMWMYVVMHVLRGSILT